MANITPELESYRKKICKIAEVVGLDFFETIFEMVTYEEMNRIAAYGGFPVRYPHWRWGMEYEQLSKSYDYGLSKIYELVINTDPCYAYLMEGNETIDQKLVMAHVYGHCDFFKNNQWFSQTSRKMMDEMANHATRVKRYMDRYGVDVVEDFIDVCLSLENLIDRHSPYTKMKVEVNMDTDNVQTPQSVEQNFTGKLKVNKPYMEKYINPPEFVQEQQQRAEEEQMIKQRYKNLHEKDILKFLINNAPLQPWQQDVMSIIRDEAYYFAPQGMTKIMNEGWASYWHSRLMTEKIMNDSEIVDFADRHSGTMAMSPTGFNPYKIGIEIFRDIENRWNTGKFGREWEECQDLSARENWYKKTDQGRDKIFEVRRNYNDVTFIDEFLTEEFCVKNKMFVYKFNKRTNQFEVDTTNFKAIKQQLLFQLTNFGQPIIKIVDDNFENRGELLLTHMFEGVELQPDYMTATLENMYKVWSRPVNLATVMDKEQMIFSFDGKEHKNIKVSTLKEQQAEQEKA